MHDVNMRYAIYYAPSQHDRLSQAAASWLGRCAFTGNAVRQASTDELSPGEMAHHTVAARRYGFHATIVAPFTLADNESEASLTGALDDYAALATPVIIPRLVLKRLGGFFALMPEPQGPDLTEFAGDVVRSFSRFCAPLSESESRRRSASAVTPSQRQNVKLWGYPFVFDDFRFHMTLTGRVSDADAPRVQAAIEDHFGALIGSEVAINSLALFLEAETDAPFNIRSFHAFAS